MNYRKNITSNTVAWEIITEWEDGSEETTDILIWKTAIARAKSISDDVTFLICEIYRRLRKLPEYDGSVAVLFSRSEFAICCKHGVSPEKYDAAMKYLIENELVSVVDKGEDYTVLSMDKTIFVTNYHYYNECGTQSDLYAGCFEVEEVSVVDKEK